MVQKSLLTLVSLLVLSLGNVLNAKEYVVSSPDKAIQMKLVVEENISYDVMYHGKTLMKQNQIALELSNGILGQSPVVKKVRRPFKSMWIALIIGVRRSMCLTMRCM